MTFRVGQKVTLISKPPQAYGYGTEILAQFGVVYTIRSIFEGDFGAVLRFHEIRNARREYFYFGRAVEMEPGFTATWFRPVVEPKIELPECLTALLDTSKHKPLREPALKPQSVA
jgi:hypothetical protein